MKNESESIVAEEWALKVNTIGVIAITAVADR